MIQEFNLFLDMIINHNIHYLPIYFIFFILIAHSIRKYLSMQFKTHIIPIKSKYSEKDVTIIIPCYKEDSKIFEKTIHNAIILKTKEVIVCVDGIDKGIRDVLKKYQNQITILYNKTRIGKRKALIQGVKKAKTKFVLFIDSDNHLPEGFVEKILKYNIHPKIVGIGTKHLLYQTGKGFGGKLAFMIGDIIENSRQIVDEGLSIIYSLAVLDGKASLWKREFILSIEKEFTNKKFLGRECHIGDDKELTYLAYKHNKYTVYSPEAISYSASQDTLYNFLKQQLRWSRSGYRFLIEEYFYYNQVSNRLKIYNLVYYLAPILLVVVILLEPRNLLNLLPLNLISFWVGLCLISILTQKIYFKNVMYLHYIPFIALIGLFLLVPLRLYSIITVNKQDVWGTR